MRGKLAVSCLPLGTIGFVLAGFLYPIYGLANGDSTSLLAEHLNAVTEVLSGGPAGSCDRLSDVLRAMQWLSAPERARLKSVIHSSETILRSHCAAEPGFLDNTSREIPSEIWNTAPRCDAGERRVRLCRYSHETGRGLFLYRHDVRAAPSNYLVCALSSNSNGGPFSTSYAITSECRVSSLSWDAYLPLDPSPLHMRSDVVGVLTWPDQDARGTPIELPVALATQCEQAFPEAAFCSPTLIALPVPGRGLIDVCSLRTIRRGVGLPFIRIESASSKWRCQRMDLEKRIVFDPNSPIPVGEENCVADDSGAIDGSCQFPYVPRTQDDWRSRPMIPH